MRRALSAGRSALLHNLPRRRATSAYGTKQTRRTRGLMSACWGEPDSTRTWSQRRLMTQGGHSNAKTKEDFHNGAPQLFGCGAQGTRLRALALRKGYLATCISCRPASLDSDAAEWHAGMHWRTNTLPATAGVHLPSFQMSALSFHSVATFSQTTTYLPLTSCDGEVFVLRLK
jgi:hypothetical protein